MSLSFEGKRVVVTGGSRGIGRAICEAFQTAGAQIRSFSRTEGVDLLDRAARQCLMLDCDILINCAGSQNCSPACDYPISYMDEDLEWIRVAFDLSQLAFDSMNMRRWGRIINISSIAGIQGTRGIIGYSIAKAALIEMTKCLSNEWAPFGITVNAIAPGYIETDMLAGLMANRSHAETIKGRIPVGRFGEPSDVAKAVLFLSSDDASYITGTVLPVDGGWLAR